jgi:hypothetical protein
VHRDDFITAKERVAQQGYHALSKPRMSYFKLMEKKTQQTN